ncbi:MAG: family protein phosphatase, partial [Pyrinomonadaceae bacterium]|nr:family protein phosphatase [Pyrinomonadaceae bacterium]
GHRPVVGEGGEAPEDDDRLAVAGGEGAEDPAARGAVLGRAHRRRRPVGVGAGGGHGAEAQLVDGALGVVDVDERVDRFGRLGRPLGEEVVAGPALVEALQLPHAEGRQQRHQQPGEDVEDLMEIAVQRANASIYQMSREQKQFSMMATTVVVLHLDGARATIGHVGDSRIYRLDPAGRLHRETEDHSVVEEEVRAGRMTPEQAENHPSRNVISRALGAEQAVEVDMKTIEVEDGTIFLLCSDGITRHIPDEELNTLINGGDSLNVTCEEMKRLCYERGAEDNLTAVIVRVGASARAASNTSAAEDEDDRTLLTERTAQMSAGAGQARSATGSATGSTARFQDPLTTSASHALPDTSAAPRAGNSKLHINTEEIAADTSAATTTATQTRTVQPENRSPTGRASRWFGVLFLLLAASAAAFYGGIRYQQNKAAAVTLAASNNNNVPAPTATATATPASELNINDSYARLRAAVDLSPGSEAQRMADEKGGRPLDETDAMFLALYGRALFLSGKYPEAVEALKRANERVDAQRAPGRDPLRLDTRLTLAAAALRAGNADAQRLASDSFSGIIEEPGAATVPSVDTVPAPER